MTCKVLTLRLDLPPGKNQSHGYGRGRVYTSKIAREWAEAAALEIGTQAGRRSWSLDRLLDWEIQMTWSVGKRRMTLDIDAPVTLAMDTISRKLNFDDEIFTRLVSERVRHDERWLEVSLIPR